MKSNSQARDWITVKDRERDKFRSADGPKYFIQANVIRGEVQVIVCRASEAADASERSPHKEVWNFKQTLDTAVTNIPV